MGPRRIAQGKTVAARDVLHNAAPLLDAGQEPAVKKTAAELRSRAGAARGLSRPRKAG